MPNVRGNKKQVLLRFDPAFLKAMDKAAKQLGMNRTEFVEKAVKREMLRLVKRGEMGKVAQ